MNTNREMLLSLLAGMVSGAFVLGIVGRAVTSGIAFLIGNSLNMSIKGVFEVIIIGMFVGGVGGVLLFVLKNKMHKYKLASSIIVGLIMYVSSIIFGIITGAIIFNNSLIQLYIFVVALIIFVIYGILTSLILSKFSHYWSKY